MENEQTLWGLPIDEARRVIEVYKYTHNLPSKDYQAGFEDGVKYMCEHISNVVDEALEEVARKSKEHMQPTVKTIPVEWIKQYWETHRVDDMTIWNMLNAWEKENENR